MTKDSTGGYKQIHTSDFTSGMFFLWFTDIARSASGVCVCVFTWGSSSEYRLCWAGHDFALSVHQHQANSKTQPLFVESFWKVVQQNFFYIFFLGGWGVLTVNRGEAIPGTEWTQWSKTSSYCHANGRAAGSSLNWVYSELRNSVSKDQRTWTWFFWFFFGFSTARVGSTGWIWLLMSSVEPGSIFFSVNAAGAFPALTLEQPQSQRIIPKFLHWNCISVIVCVCLCVCFQWEVNVKVNDVNNKERRYSRIEQIKTITKNIAKHA